jgi:dCTP deaminase
MSIKPDWWIEQSADEQGLIEPYNEHCLNPASYDLRIGREYVDMWTGYKHLIDSNTDEITLYPGMSILMSSIEYIRMPHDVAGIVYLKSSLARQGLDHALAGYVDPGFCGQLTLELHAHRPVTLQVGQRVCQLVFEEMAANPHKDYSQTGRYQGQIGPTKAR